MKSLNIEHRDRFPIKKPVPVLLQLCVDNLGVYNFHSSVSDVIHPTDPIHRIGGLQCLRDTFACCHLLYQPREHFLCLPVNVSKITVQLATGEQGCIQCLVVIFQVAPVSLTPDADMCCFILRQFQAGQIIIPLQLIPKPVLYLVINSQMWGYMSIKDEIKPSSRAAIAELKAMGKQVVMLTGDNASAAKAVADELGIDFEAEVLPDTKYEAVTNLQSMGKKVMMVGDGVNDAPALSAADVGVAIGAGTDIAIDSADAVLIKSDLGDVVKCLKIGSKVMTNIKENLFWAFFYNIILIPIACGVLYKPFNVLMNPMFASLAMSLSSVCVVCNALRLRFVKFKSENGDGKVEEFPSVAPEKSVKADENIISETKTESKGEQKMKEVKATVYIDGMMCEICKKHGKKCIILSGSIDNVKLGDKMYSLTDKNTSVDYAIKNAEKLLFEKAKLIVKEFN